ncbi:MAG: hypothetical protein D6766_01020, partial [Verrucomicrobia bacterium]
MWTAVVGGLLAAALLPARAGLVGQWDFEQGDLRATVGGDMTYLSTGGDTQAQTVFGTTTALGIPDINGQPAKVMGFPATDPGMGYSIPTPVSPNGGGALVNQWTLILDIMFPASSSGKWRSIIDTDLGLINPDGELFVNPGNGIGISGNYSGQVLPDTWHRIAFVIDQGPANVIRKYIDGVEVGVQAAGGTDGRWALTPAFSADLFADNDGDTAPGFVNSIQLWDEPLTAGQIRALGGPTAEGLPQTIPPIPSFVTSVQPARDAANASPKPLIEAVIDPGSTTIDPASVALFLDDQEVTPTVATDQGLIRVSYRPSDLFAPESQHTVRLEYTDSLNGAQSDSWSFTVGVYNLVVLPEPIVLETFDEVPEGELPPGWTVENQTDSLTGLEDLDDPNSDTYMNWTVISRDRLLNVFGERRLLFNPVVVNGEPLESLVSGNLAYAESDHRGGSQVQYLTSPDFDLTGHSDIHVAFYSSYEQNQDSMGALEYSIDGGNTWLPALYLLDGPDIITDAEGNIDAVATMQTARGDQAKGEAYGAFIGAPITQDLAPFISARVNDDPYESKRVEVVRLEQADNQSRVRLRFIYTGTASWYWGIDNVGLYSISRKPPEILQHPQSALVSAGSTVTLEVVATGTEPLAYQWLKDDAPLAGATEPTLVLAGVTAADAGRYAVKVSNELGEVQSAVAVIEVFEGPIDQDLVVHLPFDGSYADASGHGIDGAPMGAPAFQPGQIGQAVHLGAVGDYVSLGAPPELDFGTDTDFSISMWVKPVEWSSDPAFISNKDWNSGSNQGYVVATDGDAHFQWNLGGPPGGRKDYDGPPGTLGDDAWHHIVVTFDRNGAATTYIDGQIVDSRSIAASANNLDTPAGFATNIGQDGTGSYGAWFTDLSVDDVGIWRRVLTIQEVEA